MKNLIYYSTAALGLLIVLSVSIFAQTTAIEGNWIGTLDVGVKLRQMLKISKAGDGFTAKIASIDQSPDDLEVDSFSRQDKSVRFEVKKYGVSFEGVINEKGDEISGTFKQGPNSLPLIFKRTTVAVKSGRPQDPQKPYPYNEEEVAYENKKDAVKLAGTLTLPRTSGQHPAVILITGSGAQDRNETILGHHPFLVLADYLTKRGIAVLRVDDRGVGGSSIGSLAATSENFAGDVLAGIEYLKTRKEINLKQIGLIGHSEGGMIAPIVATRSKDVAFIVLMAGPGQTGEDILYTQGALIQKAGGAPAESMRLNNVVQKTIFAVMKAEPDNKLAEQKIRAALEKQMSELNEEQRKEFAPIKEAADSQLKSTLSPWFRHFITYNPRPTLEKVKIPVLAINGENDLQVSPKENLEIINAALKKSGNKDYTIKSFPKLNHLFQTSESGSPGEYATIEETIAPQILETIGDWIMKRTTVK